MPKLTLLLGRKTMRVYDIDQESISIGREEDMDIVIDNTSVSRAQAQLRKEGSRWVVEDLGSSNGTFLHGQKIDSPQAVAAGDEIGFGKFTLVFDKVVGDAEAPTGQQATQPSMAGIEGTMQIKSEEVKQLLQDSERKRRAHVVWESGGQRGQHYLSESPAALFGTDDLCDVRVPKAPKHHVLVVHRESGCEVKNLHGWSKMTVGGRAQNPATLKDGDVVKVGGLTLTYVADIS